MINDSQEWGDFSEWLSRINECLEREEQKTPELAVGHAEENLEIGEFMEALKKWVSQIEDAPVTTWREELSVRGLEFNETAEVSDVVVKEKLRSLVQGLAGMRIFLTNTDHLSDRQLYFFLLNEILDRPIAHVTYEGDAGCLLDIVGLEVQEDPVNWLQYYASNRERMEWAKQNPGKEIPMVIETPYKRDLYLPQS